MQSQGGAAQRVLVVEDSPDLRKLLTLQLTFGGYAVICADNGVEALQLADTSDPDMLLTDVLMPMLSGTDLLRRLRAMPRFSSLPVVLYTGMNVDASEDIREALLLPLVRCVQKGAAMSVMLEALAELSAA